MTSSGQIIHIHKHHRKHKYYIVNGKRVPEGPVQVTSTGMNLSFRLNRLVSYFVFFFFSFFAVQTINVPGKTTSMKHIS